MPIPEQMPFVEAVEAVTSCLVTKYTLRDLHMVDSRVSNSCFGGCFITAESPRLLRALLQMLMRSDLHGLLRVSLPVPWACDCHSQG